MNRALFLAAFLLFLIPAAPAAVHRLIERNGDVVTERQVVSVSVPQDGVLIVVPDRIFASTFSPAGTPSSTATGPPPAQKRGTQQSSSTAPRGNGPRTGQGN